MTKNNIYDVIVVGSGPGGAVTAFYLAKSGFRVALVEEGKKVTKLPAFSIDEVRLKYRNAGLTMAWGRPNIPYIEAKTLGGGSEINSGLYQPCTEEVLMEWTRTHQVEDLASLMEDYRALEQEFFSIQNHVQQGGGKHLGELAKKNSWNYTEVPQLEIAKENGAIFRKKSMSETYIAWAMQHGCEIICETKVESLHRKIRGGWFVHCTTKQGQTEVMNASNLFVCAGAIHSAALLMRSGISHNIGKTLAMHPTVKLVVQFLNEIKDNQIYPANVQVKQFAPELTYGCSISDKPYLAATMTLHPEKMHLLQDSYDKLAVYYASIRGYSTGRVRVLPRFSEPFVTYCLADEQRTQLLQGIERLSQAFRSFGVRELFKPFHKKNPHKLKMVNYHLFGTVPFGEDRKITAVNSYGKVHGYNDLFVSDASLFCSAPGVNPQATIMALARRNAMGFIDMHRKRH